MPAERNHSFAVGMETVYADGGSSFTYLPAFIDSVPEPDFTRHENLAPGGSLARNTYVLGLVHYKTVAKFYLKGSGTPGTPPEIGKLLRIAGLLQTASGSTVAYTPRDTGHESAALRVNLDGLLYTIPGARIDTLKLPFEGGSPVLCEATIVGLYADPSGSVYATPTFTDAAIRPPICNDMALTIAGNTHVIKSFELELKNVYSKTPSINAGHRGLQEFEITGRDWNGTIKVRRDATNQLLYWTNIINMQEMAVASVGLGTTGNQIALSIGNIQIEDIKPTAEEGLLYYELKVRINKAASLATEFQLLFP